MHVLHLTDFYRPIIGGVESHVETLSEELVRLGHQVTVVTTQVGDLPESELLGGVRVHRIRGWSTALTRLHADPERPFHPTVPDPLMLRRLRALLADEQPDVVHSHSWIQYSYFPLYRPDSGPGHVVMLHDYGLACVKKNYQHKGEHCDGPSPGKCVSCCAGQYGVLKGAALTAGLRASRPLLRRADAYVATSSIVAASAVAALPAGTPVTVIPAAVPDRPDRSAQDGSAKVGPRPGFLPPEDGYLLFVGTLARHKGVDVLLEAHRRMRNRVPLVLVGAPTADCFDFSGPDVHVAHRQSREALAAAWRGCAVGVVPSTWEEPLGLVAIEAMLAGRPVVASAVGGLKDLVEHAATGLLVPRRDPAALAAALDELLDDPGRRERMGRAGRERARAYQVSAVAPRLLNLFAGVLARREGASHGGRPA